MPVLNQAHSMRRGTEQVRRLYRGSSLRWLCETFDKADSTTVGPEQTWSVINGSHRVVSNSYRNGSASTSGWGVVNQALPAVDMLAEIVASVHSTTASSVGVLVRAANSTTRNLYHCRLQFLSGSWSLQVGKFVANTSTVLGEWTVTYTTGDTCRIRLQVVGSTIKAWLNGSLVGTVNDSDIAAGSYAGVRAVADTAGGNQARIYSFHAAVL
jgi:hypothetical protein